LMLPEKPNSHQTALYKMPSMNLLQLAYPKNI
jgi:hypothetical protein